MKLVLYFAAALILPLAIIITRNGDVIEILPMLLSSAGFALLLYVLVNLFKIFGPGIATIMGALLFLSALLIRFLLGFLYDFSDRGFSSEFFAHINRATLEIGLQEYDHEAWVMLIVFSGLTYFTVRLINKDRGVAALLNFGASASPELQLVRAYNRYNQLEQLRDQSIVCGVFDGK